MSDETPQTTPNDETLRKRLLSRIAAGGVVIVGLLVGVTVFDVFNAPAPPAPPVKVAGEPAKPIPPAAKLEEKPAEPAVEAKKGEEAAAEPESSAAPAAPPLAEPKGVRPLTKPATARQAMQKQAEVAPPVRPEPAREIAKGTAGRHAAPASPLARAVEATRQYILQVGVFSNVANAEDLRAKLSLNGMPSQIEARVQVGPFKTKAEADAARQKLVDLGMEPGIVLAVKR